MGRKPLEMDCIGFMMTYPTVLKKDMSAHRGFGLLHYVKDVFGQDELKENSFQICIELPFILH